MVAFFEVPDTLRAFGLLARARRREIAGPVVAITGTNGKTSTKEMLAAVLGTRYRVHATRANLNNLVGVPLTILEAPADTEALVVEAGANLPGEIARYREIIEPTWSSSPTRWPATSRASGRSRAWSRKSSRSPTVSRSRSSAPSPRSWRQARAGGPGWSEPPASSGADLVPDRVDLGADARPVITIGDIRFTLAARGLHQADNAIRVWAVVEALDLDRRASAGALGGVHDSRRPGRAAPGRAASRS